MAGMLRDVARRLIRELYIGWRFMQNDIWAGVIPGLSFTVVALRQAPGTALGVTGTLLGSLLYFCLYLYGHTLANQLVGIEEDRINKPERPLPSGLVSAAGVAWRLAIVTALFLGLGACLGVLRWAALWAVTYLLLDFYGHRHWFFKNSLPMSIGATAMLCAAWEMVLPMSRTGWHAVLTISGFVALTSPIQDFRDIAGDRVMGRKTLPISLRERPARVLVSLALLGWLPVAFALLMRPAFTTISGAVFAAALVLLESVVAVRLLYRRGPDADHRTYRWYEYLYCLYVVSALAFLS